ncbi:hypothetical protein ACFLYF_02815 [Chloroflexota bacterium]
MRRLFILGMVSLLCVLPVTFVSGCQPQPPAAPPPAAPTPPPEPGASPPAQTPEVPHYDITLVSFQGVREGPSPKHIQLFFSGEVRNDSPVELKAVDVIITSYKENGEILAVDEWNTTPWVIPPGETSQFSIRVDDYLNAVRYEVSFEHLEPGILDLSVEPGVAKEFLVLK